MIKNKHWIDLFCGNDENMSISNFRTEMLRILFEKLKILAEDSPTTLNKLLHSKLKSPFRAAQFVLRAHIPVEYRETWQLLFSSNEHGMSFAQLTHQVDGQVIYGRNIWTSYGSIMFDTVTKRFSQGPVLVVVRSTKNRVFGCYASHGEHWSLIFDWEVLRQFVLKMVKDGAPFLFISSLICSRFPRRSHISRWYPLLPLLHFTRDPRFRTDWFQQEVLLSQHPTGDAS